MIRAKPKEFGLGFPGVTVVFIRSKAPSYAGIISAKGGFLGVEFFEYPIAPNS
jgi:hypothetical protein